MGDDGASGAAVNPDDLNQLKDRMKMITDADPNQYHNEFSLKRYLRAFGDIDSAFKVTFIVKISVLAKSISRWWSDLDISLCSDIFDQMVSYIDGITSI